MPPDRRPAVAVWCVLVVAALSADVVLIRRGHASLSTVAGTVPAQVVRRYLDAHFDGLLGPLDPLGVAARAIRR